MSDSLLPTYCFALLCLPTASACAFTHLCPQRINGQQDPGGKSNLRALINSLTAKSRHPNYISTYIPLARQRREHLHLPPPTTQLPTYLNK